MISNPFFTGFIHALVIVALGYAWLRVARRLSGREKATSAVLAALLVLLMLLNRPERYFPYYPHPALGASTGEPITQTQLAVGAIALTALLHVPRLRVLVFGFAVGLIILTICRAFVLLNAGAI